VVAIHVNYAFKMMPTLATKQRHTNTKIKNKAVNK